MAPLAHLSPSYTGILQMAGSMLIYETRKGARAPFIRLGSRSRGDVEPLDAAEEALPVEPLTAVAGAATWP